MISDLKILNGELDLEFNEYIYEYTVNVGIDVDALELQYQSTCEDIEIRDNYLNKSMNVVYLDLNNEDDVTTYKFVVYKPVIEEVNSIEDYKKTLEVVKSENIDIYKVQLLGIGIFLVIIFVFTCFFKKRKIKLK